MVAKFGRCDQSSEKSDVQITTYFRAIIFSISPFKKPIFETSSARFGEVFFWHEIPNISLSFLFCICERASGANKSEWRGAR